MKGIGSTQSACVLTERAVTLEEAAAALQGFPIAGQRAAMQSWEFSGPMIGINYRPDVNGYITVDTVDHPWPDDMGGQNNPTLFGAWSMSFFGPCVYPGGLARAMQHSFLWDGAETVPLRHRAFLRVRSTYCLGARQDQLVLPRDYQALPELVSVTEVALALLRVNGALCYFNPNGEALRGAAEVEKELGYYRSGRQLPLDAVRNLRMWEPRQVPGWSIVDSVGMEQLDVVDHEACFSPAKREPSQVAYFVSVMTQRAAKGDVTRNGETIQDQKGTTWRAQVRSEGLFAPPRRTIRWFPQDGTRPPAALTIDKGQR